LMAEVSVLAARRFEECKAGFWRKLESRVEEFVHFPAASSAHAKSASLPHNVTAFAGRQLGFAACRGACHTVSRHLGIDRSVHSCACEALDTRTGVTGSIVGKQETENR